MTRVTVACHQIFNGVCADTEDMSFAQRVLWGRGTTPGELDVAADPDARVMAAKERPRILLQTVLLGAIVAATLVTGTITQVYPAIGAITAPPMLAATALLLFHHLKQLDGQNARAMRVYAWYPALWVPGALGSIVYFALTGEADTFPSYTDALGVAQMLCAFAGVVLLPLPPWARSWRSRLRVFLDATTIFCGFVIIPLILVPSDVGLSSGKAFAIGSFFYPAIKCVIIAQLLAVLRGTSREARTWLSFSIVGLVCIVAADFHGAMQGIASIYDPNLNVIGALWLVGIRSLVAAARTYRPVVPQLKAVSGRSGNLQSMLPFVPLVPAGLLIAMSSLGDDSLRPSLKVFIGVVVSLLVLRQWLLSWETDQLGKQLDAKIGELAVSEAMFRHQALHDPLTSLANRTQFVDRLEFAIGRQSRHGRAVAVLMIDLDNFKPVNDTHGHLVGDELLRSVSSRLVQCVRPGDTCARLGGDEFAIILDELEDAVEAEMVAARILTRMREPFELSVGAVRANASIGVAWVSALSTPESVVQLADDALYTAKRAGRDRVEFAVS